MGEKRGRREREGKRDKGYDGQVERRAQELARNRSQAEGGNENPRFPGLCRMLYPSTDLGLPEGSCHSP